MTTDDVDETVARAPEPRGGTAVRARRALSHRYVADDRPGARWRALRPVRLVTDVLLCLAVILVAVAGIGVAAGRLQLRPVLSGSMGHTLPLGSVAVIERIPTSSIAVGDILALHRPGTADTTYVHRVISIAHSQTGALIVQTKGDANKTPDPAEVTIVGKDAFRVEHDIPWIGYAAVWLHNRAGGALLFGGGLILVAGGWLMYRVVREREKPGQRPGGSSSDTQHESDTAPEAAVEDAAAGDERSLIPWTGNQ